MLNSRGSFLRVASTKDNVGVVADWYMKNYVNNLHCFLGKTPSKLPIGDRFIPNRSGTNFDVSAFKLQNCSVNQENQAAQSPQKIDYCKTMSDNLNGELLNAKILSYKCKPPDAPEGKKMSSLVLHLILIFIRVVKLISLQIIRSSNSKICINNTMKRKWKATFSFKCGRKTTIGKTRAIR